VRPVWSPEAIDDLISIRAYISEDDPGAVERVALNVVQNVEARYPTIRRWAEPDACLARANW
jgi:plasmid stabilization system protein ParE